MAGFPKHASLAGALDRRVTLQRATTATDAFGEPIETWATLAIVWAARQDLSDRERIAAAQVAAEITTRFQVRYSTTLADLTPKDRLLFDGRIYNIWGVKEIGRRVGLEISASARAD